MKKITLLILLIFFSGLTLIFGQKATISGTVEDAQTGEQLIGATIFDANSKKGTTTNYYGLYSLTLTKGKLKLGVSYLGYKNLDIELELKHDTTLKIKIEPVVSELQEVVVTGDAKKNVRSSQMGLVEIPMAQTKQLPVFMGEADLIKTIQLMPGVKGGTEGSSGLFVRGGSADQNLILLDKVPVYNANHLMGFFSVFNSDAIQSFQMYKGGFPARYGGRLSSVVDIKMKEGNNKEYHGEVSIGLLSSKATIEGPIIKDKCSFIISGRRTYIDLLIKPLMMANNSENDIGLYFYDINAKINYKINNKNTLYYSIYAGKDNLGFGTEMMHKSDTAQVNENMKFNMGWGNITNALRWNCLISDKLFMNTTLTYSNYDLFTKISVEYENIIKKDRYSFDLGYNSGIYDIGSRVDFDFLPSPNHFIRFGGSFTMHKFTPGINAIKVGHNQSASNLDTTIGKKNLRFDEIDAYIEDDITITSRLKVNIGAHYSGSSAENNYYHSIQPRISGRYMFTDDFSIKASYAMVQQYIHLLTNSSISLPTDLWVPATKRIKPQESWQTAIGAAYTFGQGYEISFEAYYKEMKNLIEYKEGSSYFNTYEDWQDKVTTGKGDAYGLEFMISKTQGKTTGWISYTWSKANRKFDNISFGESFPYRYDRRHDISVAVTHVFNNKYDCGFSWVYGSGLPFTLPVEKYPSLMSFTQTNSEAYNTNDIAYFKHRNSYRMPSYHRLDATINRHKKVKYGTTTWTLGAYNLYNKANPFFVMMTDNGSKASDKVLKQYSLFPIIPYVTFSFKF